MKSRDDVISHSMTGSVVELKGYISTSHELKLYDSKRSLGSTRNCISGVYGDGANPAYYRLLDTRLVHIKAVLAEYREGIIIGANQALGSRSLATFENHCGRDTVFILVGELR